jgi:hypothetical protein
MCIHLYNYIWVVLHISRLNLALLSPKLSRGIDKVIVCLYPCGFDNPRNTLRWKLLQLASVCLRIILLGSRTTNPNVPFMETAPGPPRAWKIVHRRFASWTHRNALRDLSMPPDAKTPVRRNVSRRAFYGNCTGPPKHEKYCIDVWHVGQTRMQYVTRRSHRKQKHKYSVMCPNTLFVISISVPPEHEKIVRQCFTPLTHQNALCDSHIPPDVETHVRHNVSWCTFSQIHTSPTRPWKIVRRRFTPWKHRN